MTTNADIETPRLLLRRWQEADREAFIRMNADPAVMRYFLAALSADETNALYDRIQQEFAACGYGLYAAEEKRSGSFMGFIGFHRTSFDMDFCPCVEIGWRLEERFWGKGYATEGATACLGYGFHTLGFDKVVSFTSVNNTASQRVMQKIGLQFERYFDHPVVPENHPLRPHVLYSLSRPS